MRGDVRAAANEILIYGDIGDFWWDEEPVTAKRIKAKLDEMAATDEVVVRINSPGGDAFEGVAIYNLLVQAEQRVIVRVDGTAISAASIIAMAGDEVHMAENALMMIHDPWTVSLGNASEMRETADRLDKIAGALAQTYVSRTGQALDDVRDMMAEETWMDANEALEAGFATHVDSAERVESLVTEDHLAAFRHPPANLKAAAKARPLRVAAMAIPTTPPANERGGSNPTTGEDMDLNEVQAALDKATGELASVRAERDAARSERDELKTKTEALSAQNKTLATERDAARKELDSAKAKGIEAEVDALVGVKITAAERDTFVKLASKDRELFDELVAQRVDSPLLKRDPAGMGPDPKPEPLEPEANDNGEGFANLVTTAVNG